MTNNINDSENCFFKSKCFNTLSEKELEEINANSVELNYKKGEHISKQGAFVSQIMYLKKGLVKIYKEVKSGNNLILNIFSDANLIGLPNLFGNTTMEYSVAALEDSVICAIDKKTLEHCVMTNGKFARSIIESINTCTLYHYTKIVNTTQKQLNGRMAEIIIHLANKVHQTEEFKLSLSRKELGEYAGMSLMSAVRVLKDFSENNIIEEKNGVMKILDMDHLVSVAKNG